MLRNALTVTVTAITSVAKRHASPRGPRAFGRVTYHSVTTVLGQSTVTATYTVRSANACSLVVQKHTSLSQKKIQVTIL